jgi:oxygen-independent coproporphyrinogen-3 oxidase
VCSSDLDDDMTADFYEIACALLTAAGIQQYEISNFARAGFESQHNLKYWTRQPYVGFGVDAHSMQPARSAAGASVRLATTDGYDRFFVAADVKASAVTTEQALEESFFLGLRLNRGVDLGRLREEFGDQSKKYDEAIAELVAEGLLIRAKDNLRLTPRGRLLSNAVFGRFIGIEQSAVPTIPEVS